MYLYYFVLSLHFHFPVSTSLQVKESKERAMSMLSPYRLAGSHDFAHDSNQTLQVSETGPLPFVSLLEFVSGIYQVTLN